MKVRKPVAGEPIIAPTLAIVSEQNLQKTILGRDLQVNKDVVWSRGITSAVPLLQQQSQIKFGVGG